MASKVKVRRTRTRGRTRISSKNQITIPVAALREAGLEPGISVRVDATGKGRLEVVRDDDPIERVAGLFTGMYPKGYLDKLRKEWRY